MSSIREALAQHHAATFCIVTFVLSWTLQFAMVYPLAVPLLGIGAETALSDSCMSATMNSNTKSSDQMNAAFPNSESILRLMGMRIIKEDYRQLGQRQKYYAPTVKELESIRDRLTQIAMEQQELLEAAQEEENQSLERHTIVDLTLIQQKESKKVPRKRSRGSQVFFSVPSFVPRGSKKPLIRAPRGVFRQLGTFRTPLGAKLGGFQEFLCKSDDNFDFPVSP